MSFKCNLSNFHREVGYAVAYHGDSQSPRMMLHTKIRTSQIYSSSKHFRFHYFICFQIPSFTKFAFPERSESIIFHILKSLPPSQLSLYLLHSIFILTFLIFVFLFFFILYVHCFSIKSVFLKIIFRSCSHSLSLSLTTLGKVLFWRIWKRCYFAGLDKAISLILNFYFLLPH